MIGVRAETCDKHAASECGERARSHAHFGLPIRGPAVGPANSRKARAGDTSDPLEVPGDHEAARLDDRRRRALRAPAEQPAAPAGGGARRRVAADHGRGHVVLAQVLDVHPALANVHPRDGVGRQSWRLPGQHPAGVHIKSRSPLARDAADGREPTGDEQRAGLERHVEARRAVDAARGRGRRQDGSRSGLYARPENGVAERTDHGIRIEGELRRQRPAVHEGAACPVELDVVGRQRQYRSGVREGAHDVAVREREQALWSGVTGGCPGQRRSRRAVQRHDAWGPGRMRKDRNEDAIAAHHHVASGLDLRRGERGVDRPRRGQPGDVAPRQPANGRESARDDIASHSVGRDLEDAAGHVRGRPRLQRHGIQERERARARADAGERAGQVDDLPLRDGIGDSAIGDPAARRRVRHLAGTSRQRAGNRQQAECCQPAAICRDTATLT